VANAIAMTEPQTPPQLQPSTSAWSHRILIAAVVGILFLTLYPFRFSLVGHGPDAAPYLLAGWGSKNAGMLDAFLNIALFVPYGFGFAEEVRERGGSRAVALGVALIAGALLSYTVELLQFYIPMRDSGWEDIITN
jgi:glycopeptide antibiotics resistance protein